MYPGNINSLSAVFQEQLMSSSGIFFVGGRGPSVPRILTWRDGLS